MRKSSGSFSIPALIRAAGDEIGGKVRLQKLVYLLDQMGMKSGFSFEYRHYGPYSADLEDQVKEDIHNKRIDSETRRRQSDGVAYTIYRLPEGAHRSWHNISLDEKFQEAAAKMQRHSATVLELAATIHWLVEAEECEDWRKELKRRKGAKTEEGREEQALGLLSELGLHTHSIG